MTKNFQQELMLYDPATEQPKPYPSQAAQWRDHHGKKAWLFNPWTGYRRTAEDVGSDPFGLLIVPSPKPRRGEVSYGNIDLTSVDHESGALEMLKEAAVRDEKAKHEAAYKKSLGLVSIDTLKALKERTMQAEFEAKAKDLGIYIDRSVIEVDANQDTCAGSLVFKGTRMPVRSVLSLIMAGSDVEEIKSAYPDLTGWQIAAVRKLIVYDEGYAIMPRKITPAMESIFGYYGIRTEADRIYNRLLRSVFGDDNG